MKPTWAASFKLLIMAGLMSSAHALAAEPLPIGLVNVDRLLKAHKPFQEKLEPLKAEAKDLEQTLQTRQAELETVLTQLRRAQQTQPGSPETQRLQLESVKLQGELQQFINTERQNLQKKEAAVYLSFFRELDAEISKFAKAHGLKLVLRQYDSSLDENQSLQEILKALNRNILYEEGIDITDQILKALAAKSSAGQRSGVER